MNKYILFIFALFFILTGCGKKNEVQGTGDKSVTNTQKKSDSTAVNAQNLPKFKIAFQREDGVNLINSDLTGEKYLYKGYDNVISPDGSQIAYTQSNQDGTRNIVLFNYEINLPVVLNSIEGENSFDASYSPDGKMLVFCNFSGKKWNIARVNTDDSGFKILTASYERDLFCPTFAPDGKSILCHDMQNFIEMDLNGKILRTYPMNAVFGDKPIYISSANKAYFINNKKEILFDADTEVFFETSREPISNIFVYNIESKTLKNITDEKISSYDPYPVSDGTHILFSAYTKEDLSKSSDPRDNEPVILSWVYVMNMDGTGKSKLIKNALEPSASKVE